MPIIPDFTRLRQEGCHKFKAPVDYLVSAELVREDNGRPSLDILKKKKKERTEEEETEEMKGQIVLQCIIMNIF